MNGKVGLIAGVLSTRRYAGVAAGGGAGVGLAYYFLTMPMLAAHFGAAAGLAPLHLAASLGLTAGISALAGINFALIAYRISAGRRGGPSGGATTVLGGAAAAFTPGCPACTAPLAVLLGAVGGLSLLPMQGMELKIVSAGVLAFSVYWVARGIERGSRQCCAAGPHAAGAGRTGQGPQGSEGSEGSEGQDGAAGGPRRGGGGCCQAAPPGAEAASAAIRARRGGGGCCQAAPSAGPAGAQAGAAAPAASAAEMRGGAGAGAQDQAALRPARGISRQL